MQQANETTTPVTRSRKTRVGTAYDISGERIGALETLGSKDALRLSLRNLTATYEAETRLLLNRIIAIEAEERRQSLSGVRGERSAY